MKKEPSEKALKQMIAYLTKTSLPRLLAEKESK